MSGIGFGAMIFEPPLATDGSLCLSMTEPSDSSLSPRFISNEAPERVRATVRFNASFAGV
jgi:hypothetical protein